MRPPGRPPQRRRSSPEPPPGRAEGHELPARRQLCANPPRPQPQACAAEIAAMADCRGRSRHPTRNCLHRPPRWPAAMDPPTASAADHHAPARRPPRRYHSVEQGLRGARTHHHPTKQTLHACHGEPQRARARQRA
eukprot:14781173-Alexandrium_andersonii.AAC.1